MIKAHLPPEKSVYSLPRAVPGSPKPSRPHIPVRRPAAMPVPAPETTPGNHPREPSPETTPGNLPRIRPEPLRNHSGTILHPPPGTGLETISATTSSRNHSRNHLRNHPREPTFRLPALPGPSANRGISRVPRPSAPGRGYSRARISTGSDKIMPDNAKFSHNYS